MGQKANATALRTGIIKGWKSRYYVSDKKDWATFAVQDNKIRSYFDTIRKESGIDTVEIERTSTSLKVIVITSKPGTVLGQDGANLKDLEKTISKIIRNKAIKITVEVIEVKDADMSAQIAADEIALSLENRGSFRMAQKRVIRRVMKSGAKGIKTKVSGRLNGVEMARSEGYSHGVVPLQTYRNDIDYARAEAHTTYGIIGIKVWISRGEVINGVNGVDRDAKNKPARDFKRPARDSRGPRTPRAPRATKVEAA